jgi:hypothetical protein
MSSEELMLNIFFCSTALLSAMYVSDERLKGPQYPISPPIHSPAESFCFCLAASSNEVVAFGERRPHFPPRISAKHRIRFQFLNLLFPFLSDIGSCGTQVTFQGWIKYDREGQKIISDEKFLHNL